MVDNSLMTIDEAASYLRLSRATIYKMVGRGDIVMRKLGCRSFLLRSDIDNYIEKLPRAKIMMR